MYSAESKRNLMVPALEAIDRETLTSESAARVTRDARICIRLFRTLVQPGKRDLPNEDDGTNSESRIWNGNGEGG